MNHQIIQPLFVIIINFLFLLLLLLVFSFKTELNNYKSNEKRVDHEKKKIKGVKREREKVKMSGMCDVDHANI